MSITSAATPCTAATLLELEASIELLTDADLGSAFMALGKGATVAVQLLRAFKAAASSSDSRFTGCIAMAGLSSKDPPDKWLRASAALSAAFDSLHKVTHKI